MILYPVHLEVHNLDSDYSWAAFKAKVVLARTFYPNLLCTTNSGNTEVTLREKGRVTIPASIRRDLGMSEGEKLDLKTKNGALILKRKKVVTADEIKGILGRGRVKIEETEEALGRDLS
ncbi:MAG TPA: AbrB/MazE/SpoVT family DNA-binding domain-containing protein [Nitrososphaerales archaeon]|nr:AbrB/MazE/SpoVT family DNA-binding domain-containing protein [Nitrososphaerales archaeon]